MTPTTGLLVGVVWVLCSGVTVFASSFIIPPAELATASYPLWAHAHWVWNKNDKSNSGNVSQLVDDYAAHEIPVGAVNIDSTWETQFNNFEIDTEKFSNFPGLVSGLHERGIKVLMWITSMVNVEDPDFDYAVANGFLVRNSSNQVSPIEWWHGYGGLLDYSNPAAVHWWHSRMDRVLKLPDGAGGIDGFKCDGTDPYIAEYILQQGGALGYNNEPYVSSRQYSDFYYRDFFYYTREVRGADDGLIMSRPVDCLADPPSAVCWGYSPHDVMVSGWVGDDKADWNGLRGAARKVLYSAWAGYANFAFDIGGYLALDIDKQLPPREAKELFVRWAQYGAFLPLMENGGGGEHRPWMYDEETTDIYRKFARAHTSLGHYLRTHGSAALELNQSTIRPQEASPIPLRDRSRRNFPQPKDFSYLLGPDIFVHPVLHAAEAGAAVEVDVTFPKGPDSWVDFFRPAAGEFKGGEKSLRRVALSDFPVYVRKGALLPLLSDDGRRIDFTWYLPSEQGLPARAEVRMGVSEGPGVVCDARFSSPQTVSVGISARAGQKAGIRIVGVAMSRFEATPPEAGCKVMDAGAGMAHVACDDLSRGVLLVLTLA